MNLNYVIIHIMNRWETEQVRSFQSQRGHQVEMIKEMSSCHLVFTFFTAFSYIIGLNNCLYCPASIYQPGLCQIGKGVFY